MVSKICPDISKLGGGLKYCKMEGCCNLTHREDAPEAYPCCDKLHSEANKAYWIIEKERRYYQELTKELI